mmetsp:Transcript_24905/g.45534  ORF Transcript_24905/g.45534 Transcript_24905/m.45534 type:complete len:203 (+) Transcript_24905:336-944(+)
MAPVNRRCRSSCLVRRTTRTLKRRSWRPLRPSPKRQRRPASRGNTKGSGRTTTTLNGKHLTRSGTSQARRTRKRKAAMMKWLDASAHREKRKLKALLLGGQNHYLLHRRCQQHHYRVHRQLLWWFQKRAVPKRQRRPASRGNTKGSGRTTTTLNGKHLTRSGTSQARQTRERNATKGALNKRALPWLSTRNKTGKQAQGGVE